MKKMDRNVKWEEYRGEEGGGGVHVAIIGVKR